MEKQGEGLRKEERLCSKKLIDTLFGTGGSHAMTSFPLKAVYRLTDGTEARNVGTHIENVSSMVDVQVLISVPKKHFKRAVKRNRVKRQVREAYRKHKQLLSSRMGELTNKRLLIAFIWLSNELTSSVTVEEKVENLLHRIGERI